MAGRTVSSPKGKGNVNHNNREFLTKNVDESRVYLNRIYVQEDLRVAYDKLFGEAVKEYNARVKDKHPEQVIGDYLDKITRDKSGKGKGKKPFYETIFQIGDMKDTNVRDEAAAAPAIAALDEFARSFQERNPNLYVFNMTLHLDEQTPHLHVDYIPVAREMKRGMKVQNSLARALREQNVVPEGEIGQFNNETMTWQARERAYLTELAENRGIEIISLGIQRRDYSLPEYKAAMREADQILEGAEVEAAAVRAEAESDRQAAANTLVAAEEYAAEARAKAERDAAEIKAAAERRASEVAREAAERAQTLQTLRGDIEAAEKRKKALEGEIRRVEGILRAAQVKQLSESAKGLFGHHVLSDSDFKKLTRTAARAETADRNAAKKIAAAERRAAVAEERAVKAEQDRPSLRMQMEFSKIKGKYERMVNRLEKLVSRLPEAVRSVLTNILADKDPFPEPTRNKERER